MHPDTLYLLVEGEPYLSACRHWRARYTEAETAAFNFAKGLGASGFFPGTENEFRALTVVDPVPDGWQRLKPKGRAQSRLVPAKGIAGDAARQAIADLPRPPKWGELARLINHPCQISYRMPDESASGGETCGVGVWSLVNITWAGETLAILAVDTAPRIAEIRGEHPGVIIETGEWSVPLGLRPISKARWELIMAQYRVDAEALSA